MIEISISRELAAEHPGFMAGCAERGHQVEVFDDAAVWRTSDAADVYSTPPVARTVPEAPARVFAGAVTAGQPRREGDPDVQMRSPGAGRVPGTPTSP